MKQQAKTFLTKVSRDPALKAKCLRCLKEGKKEEIEKLAKQAGCECSYQELQQAMKEDTTFSEDLTPEELMSISGGKEMDRQKSHPRHYG